MKPIKQHFQDDKRNTIIKYLQLGYTPIEIQQMLRNTVHATTTSYIDVIKKEIRK